MTTERVRSILQKIADGAPRNDFNGQSLASLERRGLMRFEPVIDPITRAVLSVNLHLTPGGRMELNRLSAKRERRRPAPAHTLDGLLTGMTEANLHGEVGPDSAVGNEFPNQDIASVRRS